MTTDPEATVDLVEGIGVLTEAECVERIRSTPLGRIGFWSDGGPLVLPVNHAWTDEGIVFRTLEGQKMAAAIEQQEVCFEVDDWDGKARTGWSVVVRGRARAVENWAEIEQLEQLGLVAWTRGEWRQLWVRVEPIEITGRRLR